MFWTLIELQEAIALLTISAQLLYLHSIVCIALGQPPHMELLAKNTAVLDTHYHILQLQTRPNSAPELHKQTYIR